MYTLRYVAKAHVIQRTAHLKHRVPDNPCNSCREVNILATTEEVKKQKEEKKQEWQISVKLNPSFVDTAYTNWEY